MDAALDRRTSEFEDRVEATRMGTIFAHDQKAYTKWSRSHTQPVRADGSGLAALIASAGGRVERGGFEFRN